MPGPHGSKQSCRQMAEEYKVSFRHTNPRLRTQVSCGPRRALQINAMRGRLTSQSNSRSNAAFSGWPRVFLLIVWAEIGAVVGDHFCLPGGPCVVSMGTERTLCTAHAPVCARVTRSQVKITTKNKSMKNSEQIY